MNRYFSAMIVIVVAAVLMVVVAADAELDAGKAIEQVDEPSSDVEEGRIRKHQLLYGGLRKCRVSHM